MARTVRHLMIGVVRFGTGTAAAIPGVVVAGKTGTAELKTECTGSARDPLPLKPVARIRLNGIGLANRPRAAARQERSAATPMPGSPRSRRRYTRGSSVGVLLVKDGAGGATAAPVARQVLEAGLQSSH